MRSSPGVGSNNCIAKGSFYRPETVLDIISRSQPTPDGVLVIDARDVKGRIGIANNKTIIGGVVDGTGETGTGAVCKLLLLPYANFSFRQAALLDQWHLQQDLDLHFEDAKRFLSGPASIGLSRPTYHAPTAEELAAEQERNKTPGLGTIKEFDFDTAQFASPVAEFDWESTNFRSTFRSATPGLIGGIDQHQATTAYLHECNKLLESIDKKRSATSEFNKLAKSQTELPVIKPGPLPSREKTADEKQASKAVLAMIAVFLLIGILGIYTLMKPSQSSFEAVPPETPLANNPPAGEGTSPGAATAAGGGQKQQPYEMPNAGPVNSAPPDNSPASQYETASSQAPGSSSTPDSSDSNSSASDNAPIPLPAGFSSAGNNASATYEASPTAASTSGGAGGPPAGSTDNPASASNGAAGAAKSTDKSRIAQTQSLPYWVSAVKRDPNDAAARKQLAHALLTSGKANESIAQFYQVMKMKAVNSSEVIEFADELTLFGSKDTARRFLVEVLKRDPTRSDIRDKINAMR